MKKLYSKEDVLEKLPVISESKIEEISNRELQVIAKFCNQTNKTINEIIDYLAEIRQKLEAKKELGKK